jgi:hypothetical protein
VIGSRALKGSCQSFAVRNVRGYPATEGVIHRACGVAAHRGHPVRVAVEGELDTGVPGQMLDVLRVRSPCEQDREAAMLY